MALSALHILQRAATRFRREETGAGSVMAMFCLTVSLVLLGLAIDVINARRGQDMLTLTADVASHAGAVALLQGQSGPDALKRAREAIEWNMPKKDFGKLISDPDLDLALVHYDQATNQFIKNGPTNAIYVKLQRSKAVDNPLPTFLGRLFGLSSWDIAAKSVAYVGDTQRCSGAAGVYARGGITLESESRVGAGVCLHSQSHVSLFGQSSFEPTSYVSMPNLSMCQGSCTDILHPGIAPSEANMIMPSMRRFVLEMQTELLKEDLSLKGIAAFFDGRPIDEFLSALDEVGVPRDLIQELETGRVVTLTTLQFSRMREYPEGLVYLVKCDQPGAILSIGDGEFDPLMQNIALVTDCALRFGKHADVRGSVVISTYDKGVTVSAEPGALAGDPAAQCATKLQTVVMALGDMVLPENFVRSNIALVAGGDVRLLGLPGDGQSRHMGLSVHAGGNVSLARYAVSSCPRAPSALLPELQLVRHL